VVNKKTFDRLDTVRSTVTAFNFIGILVGGYLIGHIMDSLGRKYACVTLRGFLGLVSSLVAILSARWVSVELFTFSHFLSGIVSRFDLYRRLFFSRTLH
jgi:MFS family permease